MQFNKVTSKHILKAIERFKEKGFPEGFGQSSTYDLIFEEEPYPPKAIMAYASNIATGEEIINDFPGGENTECFKALKQNGFKTQKKKSNMNEKLYQLKQEFLNFWPSGKLETMTLEQYTDTKRENSFCYWLEHITRDLGSIVGGSSYKFGIYKMSVDSKTEPASNRTNDGVYAWHTKYGKTAEEAFQTIKQLIIRIADYAKRNDLNPIEKIDLGDAYKWKIAFLYNDFNIVNLFKSEALRFIANSMYSGSRIPVRYGDLNQYILSYKNNEDYFDFTEKLWKHYNKYNSKEKEFKEWLENNGEIGSNKPSSYLRAIKILINELKIPVYTEDNITVLEELYDDLLVNQRDPKGKYAYSKKSYGEKGFYSAAIKTYIEFLKNEPITELKEETDKYRLNSTRDQSKPLNQILYGPPGTGKTYASKELALKIIDDEIFKDRESLNDRYKELVEKGRIVFTTFHQSMSYEDFVEGIKPKLDETNSEDENEDLKYTIEKGIFKRIAEKAKGISGSKIELDQVDFSKVNYFKMSIGGKQRIDLHNWCVSNNLVALGWGDNVDYTKYNEITNWTDFRDKFKNEFPNLVDNSKYHIQAIYTFQKMKIGDVVLVSLGNHVLDAIGIIESDYKYDSENKFGFHHYRKVKWLSTNMNASPELFVDKGISQQSIYEFYKQDIKIETFKNYFSEDENKEEISNYVLIIDEINRGNVSAIFGELITLLEEDKRSGKEEELEVILPYSKESFKVPSNLYIIGTMNTADRSVEALDTALRRRFEFKEMMPNYDVIADFSIQGYSLSKVLKTINQRIELLIDRDHTIGHSYFYNVKTLDELVMAFNNKIVPLLQEYFYGDYGKIGLVLGKGFVETIKNDKITFADFGYENSEDFKMPSYNLKTINPENIIEALDQLLNNPVEKN